MKLAIDISPHIAYAAAIALLAAGCVILYIRLRIATKRIRHQEQRLRDLTESNDDMSGRLGILEKDISSGAGANADILHSPRPLPGNGEGEFRRVFNALYPGIMARLRHDYPKLTVNDELLCMLIYLKHNTDEVSVYLDISKSSVNSARYRLRQKFSLSKSDDLDEFITGRQ